MEGFDGVRDRAVLNKKPRRVRIERARSSGNLSAVLRGLGTKEEMLSELAVLNGRGLEDRVRKGDWVKVVRN